MLMQVEHVTSAELVIDKAILTGSVQIDQGSSVLLIVDAFPAILFQLHLFDGRSFQIRLRVFAFLVFVDDVFEPTVDGYRLSLLRYLIASLQIKNK
jgi:hypothetical protein